MSGKLLVIPTSPLNSSPSPSGYRVHTSRKTLHIGLDLVGCIMDISPNAPKICDGAVPSGITLISDRLPNLGVNRKSGIVAYSQG